MTTPAPGSFAAWWMASRPPTLAAAVVPVAVGAACAFALGGFRWAPTLAALFGAIWIQIGTNFANDVFDFEKGADTIERLGPTRAVQAGLLSPAAMRRGMWAAFAVALACGVAMAWFSAWPILVVGVVSILAGIAYTGGPYPLGYNGLGDIFVMLFFGFVAVVGTAWVNLLEMPALAFWAAIPVGALSTNILAVNNLRDREGDAAVGKRTLVARFGRRFGEVEYALMLLLAYAVPVVLFVADEKLLGANLGGQVLAPLLTLPLAGRLMGQVLAREGRELNATLVGSAKLLVFHGGLLALGVAVGSTVA